jgi:uncharacterized protein YhbP (UPF0306 family)
MAGAWAGSQSVKPADLVQFLTAQSTLTLATVGPDNRPAAADLYFAANDALDLFFLSEPGARHAQNIAGNPAIAATIHPAVWDWREIRGVQIEGTCRAITAPSERLAALALYGKKFSFLSTFAAALGRHTVFCITPTWMRWVDNNQKFGFKEEWTI